MDLGQHHVRLVAGEGAFAADRRQLAGIAEHEDRLAEAHQIARHLLADHRHLVEHDEPGVRGVALRVQGEARVLHRREPLAHRLDRGIGRSAREPGKATRVALGHRDLPGGFLDLLLGRLDHRVDQAVDGARRRALACQHQRGFAGEGGGHDAGHAAAVFRAAVGREAEFFERELQDGALAGPGIAEQAEHLLLFGPGLEPLLDLADRGGLGGGWGELGHGWRASTA